MNEQLQLVEDALSAHGSKKYGADTWNCPCGNHSNGDRKPSLSVREGHSQPVIMNCNKGSSVEEVLAALGLVPEDLCNPRSRNGKAKELAVYDYKDETGAIVAHKVRTDDPTYKYLWYHMENEEWVKKIRPETASRGMGDSGQNYLYNLPALLDAIRNGEVVYVVEGERDVETLRSEGLIATTNYDGAGKWKSQYNQWFKGAGKVVIIADNDEPGYSHAEHIRKELSEIAGDVKVYKSATTQYKDDVTDHILAGYKIEDLVPVENHQDEDGGDEFADLRSKYACEDFNAIFDELPEGVQWLYDPVLEVGTLNVLYGDRGNGKSLVILEMAAKLAWSGKSILYVDNENRKVEYRDRLRSMGYRDDPVKRQAIVENLHLLLFSELPPLDTEEGGRDLRMLAKMWQADLVIIDTRSRFARGKENESDTYLNMYNMSLQPLKAMGLTVVLLDHIGKNRDLGPRGSSAKGGDIDTEWFITAPKANKNRYLECTKNRPGRVEVGYKITLEKTGSRENGTFNHKWHFPNVTTDESGNEESVVAMSKDAEILGGVWTKSKLPLSNKVGYNTIDPLLRNAGYCWGNKRVGAALREYKAAMGISDVEEEAEVITEPAPILFEAA